MDARSGCRPVLFYKLSLFRDVCHVPAAQANSLPQGALKERLLRKARQAETGSHISEWLSSPGLRTPH
jgi:hypothetical protein